MSVFGDFSIVWTIGNILLLFYYLFDSKFDNEKTIKLTLMIMGPLALINSIIFAINGPLHTLYVLPVTFLLPGLCFYCFISKYHDAALVTIYFVVITISLEILMITSLIEHFFFNNYYIFTFISRFFIFPALVYYVYFYFKQEWDEVHHQIIDGWNVYAIITILLCCLLTILYARESLIIERSYDLPAMIILFAIIPLVFVYAFQNLKFQTKLTHTQQQEQLIHMEVVHLRQRITQLSESEKHIRIERHNMRHRIQTLISMLSKNEISDALKFLEISNQQLNEASPKRWCANNLLDAVFSIYFKQAEALGIKIEAEIRIPEILPLNDNELSIVFANALENAINACKKVPQEERYIRVICLCEPQYMFSISNSFDGKIKLDSNGHPIATKKNHGLGTQSITAFCNKNNAFCDYKVKDNRFTLRILLNQTN